MQRGQCKKKKIYSRPRETVSYNTLTIVPFFFTLGGGEAVHARADILAGKSHVSAGAPFFRGGVVDTPPRLSIPTSRFLRPRLGFGVAFVLNALLRSPPWTVSAGALKLTAHFAANDRSPPAPSPSEHQHVHHVSSRDNILIWQRVGVSRSGARRLASSTASLRLVVVVV